MQPHLTQDRAPGQAVVAMDQGQRTVGRGRLRRARTTRGSRRLVVRLSRTPVAAATWWHSRSTVQVGRAPDLLGIGNAVGKVGEGRAVVEIRGVNDVSRGAEVIGEGETPRRQSLCMLEERQLSHGGSLAKHSRRRHRPY
ncbi:MAG: hypothetical protein M3336_06385 [Chloroflexota bacterium]|nr:hypothetical protein [Chloroflexota bacterium]